MMYSHPYFKLVDKAVLTLFANFNINPFQKLNVEEVTKATHLLKRLHNIFMPHVVDKTVSALLL